MILVLGQLHQMSIPYVTRTREGPQRLAGPIQAFTVVS